MNNASPGMQRMLETRLRVSLDDWGIGSLLGRLKLVEDPTRPRGWTDGTHLGFNPTWVLGLRYSQLRSFILHEISHCVLGHPWRMPHVADPKLKKAVRREWNRQCDKPINHDLKQEGHDLDFEGGVMLPESDEEIGKSAEWLFARAWAKRQQKAEAEAEQKKQQEQEQQGGASGQPSGDGDDSEQNDDDSQPEQEQEQQGGGADAEDDDGNQAGGEGGGDEDSADDGGDEDADDDADGGFGEVLEAPPAPTEDEDGEDGEDAGAAAESKVMTEADWREAVTQAAAISAMQQQQGQPGAAATLERLERIATQSFEDWRSVLSRWAQERARAEFSWRRPNARYMQHGFVLPGLHSEQMGLLAVAVDTSGSIDKVLLGEEEAHLNAIKAELRPLRTLVLYCDTKVHRVEEYGPGEDIHFRAVGGGSTDFRPVFAKLDEMGEEPACLVYLTDMYGRFPEQDPGIPTIWVTGETPYWRGRVEPPFGEVIEARAGRS